MTKQISDLESTTLKIELKYLCKPEDKTNLINTLRAIGWELVYFSKDLPDGFVEWDVKVNNV